MSQPVQRERSRRASLALGASIAFLIGLSTALLGIAAPSPPTIQGALIVGAMTAGYVLAGRFVVSPPANCDDICAGPSGVVQKHTSAGRVERP